MQSSQSDVEKLHNAMEVISVCWPFSAMMGCCFPTIYQHGLRLITGLKKANCQHNISFWTYPVVAAIGQTQYTIYIGF